MKPASISPLTLQSAHGLPQAGTTPWRTLIATALLLATLFALAWPAPAHAMREIDWVELIPPDELAELEKLADSGQFDIDHDSDLPAPVFGTARTVALMDGVSGKMPGYIVPLETDAQNRVTEFFLVPYYGACIHVPPPPPNQIVYVKPREPIPNVEIWNPYWIEGTLRVQDQKNDVAAASYAFDLQRVVPYQ